MSVTQDLGKIMCTPRGEWISGTVYEILDIVSFEGSSFIAKKDVPEGVSISNEEYWMTIAQKGSDGANVQEEMSLPYTSLERVSNYLYKISFDTLPEISESTDPIIGGCSSYVADGKLFRNLDWTYAETAEFIVKTKKFSGMAYINGMNDSELDNEKIKRLPYQVVDGVNESGIMVATHVLYNDWEFAGCGDKNINILNIPFLILNNITTLENFDDQMADYLNNIQIPESLDDMGYLLHFIVSDGVTTYVIEPPEIQNGQYIIIDATSNPKLTNFRWVNRAIVSRSDADIQTRPIGIERFNAMPCNMSDIKFTNAYETPNYLSDFIGERNTTKDSTDDELLDVYDVAREIYLSRTRDGQTWQTMHSITYSSNGMESLFIQEKFDVDLIGKNVDNGSGSGLPDASDLPDGTAMIAAGGEWRMQEGYGYTEGGRVSLLTQDEVDAEFMLFEDASTAAAIIPIKEEVLSEITGIQMGATPPTYDDIIVIANGTEHKLIPHDISELGLGYIYATADFELLSSGASFPFGATLVVIIEYRAALLSNNPDFLGTHTISMYASSEVTHPISPELIPTDPEESNGYFYMDNELTELVSGGEKVTMPDGTINYRYETPGMYENKSVIMPLTHVTFERDENGENVCTLFDYEKGIFFIDPTLGWLVSEAFIAELCIGNEAYIIQPDVSGMASDEDGIVLMMHAKNTSISDDGELILELDIKIVDRESDIVLKTTLDIPEETTISLSINTPTELISEKMLTAIDNNGIFLLSDDTYGELRNIMYMILSNTARDVILTIDGIETTMSPFMNEDSPIPIPVYEDEIGNALDLFNGFLIVPGKQEGDTITVSMRLSDDPVILADNNTATVEFVLTDGGVDADITDVWNSIISSDGVVLPNLFLQNLLIDIDGEQFYAKNVGFMGGEFGPQWMAFRIDNNNQFNPALVFGDLGNGTIAILCADGSIAPGEHTITVGIAEQVNYLTDDEVEISFAYDSDANLNFAYIDDVDKDILHNLTGCLEITLDGDKYYGIIDIDGETAFFACGRFVAGIPVDADDANADFYVAYDGFVDEGWYVVDLESMFTEGTHTLSIKSADFDFRMAPNMPATVHFEQEVQNPKVNITEYLDHDTFVDAIVSGNYIMPHINGERMFFSNVENDMYPILFVSQSMWIKAVNDSEVYLVSDGSVEEADVEIFTKPELDMFDEGFGLPDPTDLPDGTAMIAVNGEWKMQSGYGYKKTGVLNSIENVPFDMAYIPVNEIELMIEDAIESAVGNAIGGEY